MKTAHLANIKPARKPKLGGPGARSFSVTIEASMPSEIDAISPLMDQPDDVHDALVGAGPRSGTPSQTGAGFLSSLERSAISDPLHRP
jgi:hypothetical protein